MTEQRFYTNETIYIDVEVSNDDRVKLIVSVKLEDGSDHKIVSHMLPAVGEVLLQKLQNALDQIYDRKVTP